MLLGLAFPYQHKPSSRWPSALLTTGLFSPFSFPAVMSTRRSHCISLAMAICREQVRQAPLSLPPLSVRKPGLRGLRWTNSNSPAGVLLIPFSIQMDGKKCHSSCFFGESFLKKTLSQKLKLFCIFVYIYKFVFVYLYTYAYLCILMSYVVGAPERDAFQ